MTTPEHPQYRPEMNCHLPCDPFRLRFSPYHLDPDAHFGKYFQLIDHSFLVAGQFWLFTFVLILDVNPFLASLQILN